MIIVDEIVDAELPYNQIWLYGIDIAVQDQILLQRAIPAGPVREDFHAEHLSCQGIKGLVVRSRSSLREGIPDHQ